MIVGGPGFGKNQNQRYKAYKGFTGYECLLAFPVSDKKTEWLCFPYRGI